MQISARTVGLCPLVCFSSRTNFNGRLIADSTHYLHMYACVFIFKDVFIKPRNLCDLVELSAMRALPLDVSWQPKFVQNKNTYKTKIEVEIKSI